MAEETQLDPSLPSLWDERLTVAEFAEQQEREDTAFVRETYENMRRLRWQFGLVGLGD